MRAVEPDLPGSNSGIGKPDPAPDSNTDRGYLNGCACNNETGELYYR